MQLKDYLYEERLSYGDFAHKLGIHKNTVYVWTTGRTVPRPETMAEIVALTDGKVLPQDFYNLPYRTIPHEGIVK